MRIRTAFAFVLSISIPSALSGQVVTSSITSGPSGQFTARIIVHPPPIALPGVQGAPYSAAEISELTQTLADGNRIRQTVTAKIYRDSEGRVRNEQSLAGLGALAPNAAGSQVVYINDPVAGVNYALDLRQKRATAAT